MVLELLAASDNYNQSAVSRTEAPKASNVDTPVGSIDSDNSLPSMSDNGVYPLLNSTGIVLILSCLSV